MRAHTHTRTHVHTRTHARTHAHARARARTPVGAVLEYLSAELLVRADSGNAHTSHAHFTSHFKALPSIRF